MQHQLLSAMSPSPVRRHGAYSLAIQRRRGIVGGMRVSFYIALAVMAAAFTAPVHADDGLRCGQRLVRQGDPRSQVRAFCGEPDDVQTRTILRRPVYELQGRRVYFGDNLVEIPVETWTYNFGPNKLMRRVRFVDGLVDEVETLGYGYNDPQRGSYENRRGGG
jgi:hypothetical protein